MTSTIASPQRGEHRRQNGQDGFVDGDPEEEAEHANDGHGCRWDGERANVVIHEPHALLDHRRPHLR